jgi:cell division protein FtsB
MSAIEAITAFVMLALLITYATYLAVQYWLRMRQINKEIAAFERDLDELKRWLEARK